MKKILIVEDDPFLIDIYVTKFEKRGYNVTSAKDGEEALECALREPFDIIMLDIILPKMDGWDVLREIRNSKERKDARVVVLSNSEDDSKRIQQQLRVEKHLIKAHYTPEETVKEVEELL
ncbi:MAG: response regulator [Candidatus Nealsonbacteria bacterium]|nr:response regulator [Candidatus Nealsonbacteria bacterium]